MWLAASTAAQAQVIQNPVQPSAITPTTQQFEIGPTLDVVPYVLSDGYTINLTLIPQLLQFNGYDTPPVVVRRRRARALLAPARRRPARTPRVCPEAPALPHGPPQPLGAARGARYSSPG